MEESMRKRLIAMSERYAAMEEELSSPDIGNDIQRLTKLTKERASMAAAVEKFQLYLGKERDAEDALIMADSDEPEMAEFAKEVRKSALSDMENLEQELKILLLPKDPNDDKNIIVEIRGAVGGDEADIFAGDLTRMYIRYAEKQGWKIKVLDASEGPAGGYSSISFMTPKPGVLLV